MPVPLRPQTREPASRCGTSILDKKSLRLP
jgi:hypothetical protein